MNAEQITNAIKCLDKTSRQDLSKRVRSDANAWNGINGMGTMPEDLPKGKFQGLVKCDEKLLSGVQVVARQGGDIANQTVTDSKGFYSLDLNPGKYDIVFVNSGYYDTLVARQTVITENLLTLNGEMTKIR